MKKTIISLAIITLILACKTETKDDIEVIEQPIETIKKSTKELKEELTAKGFELFDYVDEKTQDTVIMQKYFIAFLKKGPNRSQPEEEANKLQAAHMAHLGKMYELGYADISGPFEDDSDISGITIYNVPTLQMADSLANADPMVKAGRLVIEMHPWWAAKGFSLR
ncbi:YciI family protein [Flavobacteriaceae bacterium S0862]|nr:YciI family protein [Flavobacteriaceae bacterium S0862]